ncbi:MAG: hypothetical protein ACOH2R_17495 [Pseudomonas sp.]
MKDRSFIHRQAQSNAAKADNLRRFGPAQVRDPFPAPKLRLWAQLKAFIQTIIKWWKA